MTWEPWARDWRIVAVVAEPEEKARAKRACSRAATARSKLSLELSASGYQGGMIVEVPVRVGASGVFVCAYWLADACLRESRGEGDLRESWDEQLFKGWT